MTARDELPSISLVNQTNEKLWINNVLFFPNFNILSKRDRKCTLQLALHTLFAYKNITLFANINDVYKKECQNDCSSHKVIFCS